MITCIPDYIEARIRQAPPDNHHVLRGTTPVVAFGNAQTARVATLGINPSKKEFLNKQGQDLDGKHRRFETLYSLDVPSLAHAPTESVHRVLQACNSYFGRKPYWTWFGHLERLLALLDASYKTGSACHLDLVQWATDPVWGELPLSIQSRLIQADISFLQQQLKQEQIETLLLNGTTVIEVFQNTCHISLKVLSNQVADNGITTRFVAGYGSSDLVIVGWRTNLQSTPGVTRVLRQRIAHEVSQIVSHFKSYGI